jgi:NADP-dependent 3-hydroxy acid dehydrogenase YdfG
MLLSPCHFSTAVCSELLLERGYRVAGTVRTHDAVTDLQERHPELLWLGVLDVTDIAAVHEVVDRAFTW